MRQTLVIIARAAILAGIWISVSAFSIQNSAAPSSQPTEERKAQDALPQSGDPMWNALFQCKVHYDDKTHKYSITYTPEVKAMEGKPMTIAGFMLPLEATEKFNHFLISKRTPTCPFCPPGEPNEIAEVFTQKPVKYDEGVVVVTGTFRFTTNPDLGLFFQLKDATASSSAVPIQLKSKLPLI